MLKKILIFSFSYFLLSGCQTVNQNEQFYHPLDYVTPVAFLKNEKLRSLDFSSDGNSVLFIQEATSNRQQIFEYHFLTNTKNQVTHQVGVITEALYYPSGSKIIYVSTTDEDKESPYFLRSNTVLEENGDLTLRSEIYTSNRNGGNIERLTKHSGFDGQVSIHPISEEMIYSEKNLAFFRLKKGRKYFQLFYRGKGNNMEPSFAPDGNQLVWVNEEKGEYHLAYKKQYLKHKVEMIPMDFSQIKHIRWNSRSSWILFSAKKQNTNSDIYAYSFAKKCLLRLTYHPANDKEPIFHPNNDKWYFLSDRKVEYTAYEGRYFPLQQCINKME